MKHIKIKSVMNLIKKDHPEISYALIERAFGLPIGEIKRTIKFDPNNKEMLSLLKIVYLYPWILNVAMDKFDRKTAKKEFLKHAVDTIIEIM